jgi:hypothetical protein
MGSMVALLVAHFTVAGRRNPDKKINFSFQTFGFSFSIWLGQLFLGTAYPLIYVFELKLEEWGAEVRFGTFADIYLPSVRRF